jgi:hypothetical protein
MIGLSGHFRNSCPRCDPTLRKQVAGDAEVDRSFTWSSCSHLEPEDDQLVTVAIRMSVPNFLNSCLDLGTGTEMWIDNESSLRFS